MADQKLHVIVVGAGLGGLAVAHGLEKNNISYVIVDRETTPRDRNWGVTMSWAHPLIEKLIPADLYANISACQPDQSLDTAGENKETVLIRDGASGETKVEVRMPGIRRMQIKKTKREWAKGINIKYGKKLVDITTSDDGVTAHFEDGTEEKGSVIIGADGGTSQVRKWLLGDLAAPEVLPYQFMNFSFTMTAERALYLDGIMNPNVDVATHPKNMYLGLFLLDKPDLSKPETWVFYLLVTWPLETKEDEENADNRLERLRAHMEGWADPYKSVVDMTFHRGQGGNLAIKDGFEFVNGMVAVQKGEKTLEAALKEYDAGVMERGKEVDISKEQAMAFHDYANFEQSPIYKMGIKPVVT
ncbi:hypothetical protein EG327_009301 [Venturia inaequalis]|uniref:FAD-binding domain-containing protein n=1 Tax=Venturia inaequalis TaxID=5025 RepID=A0A8H3VRP9_VENIN|nr:hypothetical protein EG327_009301 [Venturia inaequalis]